MFEGQRHGGAFTLDIYVFQITPNTCQQSRSATVYSNICLGLATAQQLEPTWEIVIKRLRTIAQVIDDEALVIPR